MSSSSFLSTALEIGDAVVAETIHLMVGNIVASRTPAQTIMPSAFTN